MNMSCYSAVLHSIAGHGPYSHVFDSMVTPQLAPENPWKVSYSQPCLCLPVYITLLFCLIARRCICTDV